MFSEQRLL